MASIIASRWTGVSAIGWPSELGYSTIRGTTEVRFIGRPSGTGGVAVEGGGHGTMVA